MFVNVVPPLVLDLPLHRRRRIAAGRRRERDRLPAVIVWLVGLVVTTGQPDRSPSASRRVVVAVPSELVNTAWYSLPL